MLILCVLHLLWQQKYSFQRQNVKTACTNKGTKRAYNGDTYRGGQMSGKRETLLNMKMGTSADLPNGGFHKQ